MKRAFAAIAFLSMAACTPSPQSEQSDGWRDATRADVEHGEDMRFRAENPTLLLSARGDFDGDGVEDNARLQVNEAQQQVALLITDGTGEHRLAEVALELLPRLGVAVRAPGNVTSSWEAQSLNLTTDAVDLFVFESSDTLYYSCHRGYCPYQISD